MSMNKLIQPFRGCIPDLKYGSDPRFKTDLIINIVMKQKYFLTVLFFLNICACLRSQCTPPPSESCNGARVICSLSELNGYCCTMLDQSNPTGCSPLCPEGGEAHNTSWWAFVSQGGPVTITVTTSNCSVNGTGVQLGIWGDCSCTESIVCNPVCMGPSTYNYNLNLEACKTYYLFVDGCNGDVCDICLKTTELSPPPVIPPMKPIEGPGEICQGARDVRYTVKVEGNCKPGYVWTLDGQDLGSNGGEVFLSFKDKGDFVLCASAYIGNPNTGSVCDQKGPVCRTIRVVDQRVVVVNANETLCLENSRNYRLRQNCLRDSNGQVICRGRDSMGCAVDTIINFIVLDIPEPPEVCYLPAHLKDVYVDSLTGRSFTGCHYNTRVYLPKSTDPYRCDSSYRLNMFLPEYTGAIRNFRVFGKNFLELVPRDISRTCGNTGIRQELTYSWYHIKDPLKRTLSKTQILQVNGRDTFCVDLSVRVEFCNIIRNYNYTFCGSNTKGPKVNRDSPFPDTTRNGFRDGSVGIRGQQTDPAEWREDEKDFIIQAVPNPSQTNQRTVLRSNRPIDEVYLVDINGRIVWSQKPEEKESLQLYLDVQPAPGVYHLIGLSSEQKSHCRLVILP